jgi:hypothetical protein
MTKTLKRKIIIRADHFVEACKVGLEYNNSLGSALYDRAKFVPLTINDIDQYWTFAVLKNLVNAENSWHIDKTLYFLRHHSTYSNEYAKSIFLHSQDNKYFSVLDRRSKEILLGWGIFEKDFKV